MTETTKPKRVPLNEMDEAQIRARVETLTGAPIPPDADLVAIARRYERTGRVLRDWLKDRGLVARRKKATCPDRV